ncbi:nucleoside deaminase [Hippea maritima]|uniref:CMP/dCMP deaminase zinc-binding protein n=1 Tax=Hippea maritima (strain ATCC 700847 / DSM 10411 / MH2) TaxID=760142 RepID=F2LWV5_HIPMA|nr:nucleoside deaminase [Hippea maritima]AEA33083.1 CMP/dCMP deaminase zinc-binding protein [Hippea maritima DSM 10411]
MQTIKINLPNWLTDRCKLNQIFKEDKEKMLFAIELAKLSIRNGGGPFGAAIFSKEGKLVSCGVNLVTKEKLSILHAEIVAFIMAQKKLKTYSLSEAGYFELFSSSEPCAMCLGAILWSGIKRVVFGAYSDAARNIGFDEGPVFEASWNYLKNKGIIVEGGLLKDKAAEVLVSYKELNGVIYNP